MEAQIDLALDSGIDVTHVDTHMGSIYHSRFLTTYVQVALQHRLPPFLVRVDAATLRSWGMRAEAATQLLRQLEALGEQSVPLLLDHYQDIPLDQPDHALQYV